MPPHHPQESDALRGSVELLILKALALEPMHGWGIGLRIQALSRGRLDVNQGSLYPALQRMRRAGWIRSEWRVTESNRRARYYLLTPAGRRQLATEAAAWEQTVDAIRAFLRMTTVEDAR